MQKNPFAPFLPHIFSSRFCKGCCIGKTFGHISCGLSHQQHQDFPFSGTNFTTLLLSFSAYFWNLTTSPISYGINNLSLDCHHQCHHQCCHHIHLSCFHREAIWADFLWLGLSEIPPRSWDKNPLFSRKSKPDFFNINLLLNVKKSFRTWFQNKDWCCLECQWRHFKPWIQF